MTAKQLSRIRLPLPFFSYFLPSSLPSSPADIRDVLGKRGENLISLLIPAAMQAETRDMCRVISAT